MVFTCTDSQLKKGKRINDAEIGPKMKPKIEKALRKVFQFYCPNDGKSRLAYIFYWLLFI
jgi:hypothetical protein